MIGLDTNILVRYLAQDDATQAAQATQIIEHELTDGCPGFISLVTIVETVWVLDRVYGLSSQEVADAVERILRAHQAPPRKWLDRRSSRSKAPVKIQR